MDTEFITVRIDKTAHWQAKAAAARQQKSLQDFIRDALLDAATKDALYGKEKQETTNH